MRWYDATILVAFFGFIVCAAAPAAGQLSPEKAGTRWALLIGVDDYGEIRKLRFAGDDQRALAAQLISSGFPPDQVFLLHDKATENKYRPFRENIERQLELVMGLANRGDLVIVSFSGHGMQLGGKSYLCPVDTRIDKLATTMIPLDGIYDRLSKCPATLKLLMVDACRSDVLPEGRRSVTVGDSLGGFAGPKEKPPEGVLLLTSCAPGQISMEDEAIGHGVFMHYLLEGLRGQAANTAGTVSLAGLYDYASLQTKKYVARKFNDYQTPALRGQINGPFEICNAASGKLIVNSIGLKMALIPSGEFMMGNGHSPDEEVKAFAPYVRMSEDFFKNEYPQHRVRITRPFYLGMHEVTVGQFRQFVNATGYKTDAEKDGNGAEGYDGGTFLKDNADYSWRNAGAGFPQTDEHPVVNVTWNDAVAFCDWLSRKEDKTYRLPTEAEWEYACRAGTTTRYHSGDDPETLAQVGNVADTTTKGEFSDWVTIQATDGYAFTAPVGKFRPNAFGLYDMHGNAWEWCSDRYDSKYYAISPTEDPTGPDSGSYRILRGGAWAGWPAYSRTARRLWSKPDQRDIKYGFRIARTQSP